MGCVITVLVLFAAMIVTASLWASHPDPIYWIHQIGMVIHALGSWWHSGPVHGKAPSPGGGHT